MGPPTSPVCPSSSRSTLCSDRFLLVTIPRYPSACGMWRPPRPWLSFPPSPPGQIRDSLTPASHSHPYPHPHCLPALPLVRVLALLEEECSAWTGRPTGRSFSQQETISMYNTLPYSFSCDSFISMCKIPLLPVLLHSSLFFPPHSFLTFPTQLSAHLGPAHRPRFGIRTQPVAVRATLALALGGRRCDDVVDRGHHRHLRQTPRTSRVYVGPAQPVCACGEEGAATVCVGCPDRVSGQEQRTAGGLGQGA